MAKELQDPPNRIVGKRTAISRWRLLWWLPAAAWAGGIFRLSSMPIHPPKGWWSTFPHLDKLVHMALFGILSALVFVALRWGHGLRLRTAAVAAAALTIVYGATDEWHQLRTPHRSADVRDLAADAAGAAAVAAAASALAARRRRPLSPVASPDAIG